MDSEAQQIAAELSSPPSSLSDLSPQRSDPHLASRDTSVYGVSQHPLQPQPQPSSATVDEKPKRNTRAPVILADGEFLNISDEFLPMDMSFRACTWFLY